MDLARPAGPTLKITRHRDARLTGSFGFEVWNPFTANYQPASSLADGLRRAGQLAWTRSGGGKARVTEMVCNSVGYAQPPPR